MINATMPILERVNDLDQYELPENVIKRINMFLPNEKTNHKKDFNSELKYIQILGLVAINKAIDTNQPFGFICEIAETLQDYKMQYWIYYVSLLAYKLDNYQDQKDYARMLTQQMDLTDEYTDKMKNFVDNCIENVAI